MVSFFSFLKIYLNFDFRADKRKAVKIVKKKKKNLTVTRVVRGLNYERAGKKGQGV